ncbi:uncharacterized protein MELLADRAFT_88361 [Melampsora larici-populina 98AG31]|uniref:Uncharacterized protein n=1 Tax=Melampsora larici-populina (strain 98AG31 / pathotype 3-4-7) TaxID=747676 RepID=F4RRG0_MELLP|nr:uncharacterized protein MELLADRAFT_88361 [Melampsora larici-populina 98AG31]EGG04932.1 hypothetical protein MELLADRAFT_88361 [Melampsora larici-populina 98AG31]
MSTTSTPTSTSTSTSIDPFNSSQHPNPRRNSICKSTLPINPITNTIIKSKPPRHSIHQIINSNPIQPSSTTKPSSPSKPSNHYSNGFLNSSTSSTTTSLTLHHNSSPASISFDKPSTISFLSDLISNNDSISSPTHPLKLNRYTLSSSTSTPLNSSSNTMPSSPITSTSNSNSTSTNSSNLSNPHISTSSTTPTPNTSLTTSTRAGPSRSNTLTVPLNHASNSINNPRNGRGLRSSDAPNNQSLQSSSSSSQSPQPPQQVPTSPSPSRGEPSNGAISTNPQTGQLEAKVVILGMQGVGKTSIVHRYTTGSFSYSLASTIGASFCTKKLSVDGCKVRLQIWDTAGQERFRSMAPMYYRGANAAILVYDITNQSSFEDIQNWLHELSANMSPELVIQIVGSKADLATDKRSVELEVAYQQILEWTESFPFTNHAQSNSRGEVGHSWPDLAITEVSAKDDFGIEDMFLVVTRRLVMRKAEIEEIRLRKSRESVLIEPRNLNQSNSNHHDRNQNGTGWCC